MSDLIGLSSAMIDTGVAQSPPNRVTQELSEVADDVAVVESFSHVVAFRTGEGLVLFDTSLDTLAPACLASLRGWPGPDPLDRLHPRPRGPRRGRRDLRRRSRGPGRPRPGVVGHENVAHRFDRYR